MSQAQLPYVLLYLCSTFLSAVSQVLLKKAALREHKSVLAEYTDWRVILGYALFVGCTLLTMLAYKGVPRLLRHPLLLGDDFDVFTPAYAPRDNRRRMGTLGDDSR